MKSLGNLQLNKYIFAYLKFTLIFYIYIDLTIASLVIVDNLFNHTISNHPVHVVDKNNNVSSSAFIPFCSFAGNMSIVGREVQNFEVPVCNKFMPIVLEGQLCYQLDVNILKNQIDRNKLMTHGLSFMMDYNTNRMGPDLNSLLAKSPEENISDEKDDKDTANEAMIYIETLGK
jgi:hypothetical protein